MNYGGRLALIFGFIFSFPYCAFSQTGIISGVVIDQQQQMLVGASIALLKVQDSSLITGTTSDVRGMFKIEKITYGNYLLKSSFIGYTDVYRKIELVQPDLSLNNIILFEKTQNIGEIEVEGKIPPAQQNGDTSQFNANAFKTNQDANAEELVTKMPGVIIQDGKIQAQGEEVKTVLVDGKPFFGDDPNTVLKNIPAEIIDKIQVFDRRSDQSAFTGFDDGNVSKTINIVTRPQFRNGTFGKLFAGYGDQNKYKSGATVNFFNGKRRFTILAQSNNINEQNFSMEDLAGVASSQGNSGRPVGMGGPQSGGYRGGSGGSGGGGRQYGGQNNEISNFLVSQSSGINTTHAFGMNYANQWKKIDFTGSYFFNWTGNKTTSDVMRQYIVSKNEGLAYFEFKNTKSNNINHRLNLKFEYRIDSMRSVSVTPKISAQLNNGSNVVESENSLPLVILNKTDFKTDSKLTQLNFSIPVFFRNAFPKKGRTISLTLTPSNNSYLGRSYLNSGSEFLIDTLDIDSINQFGNLDKSSLTLNANLIYTEPLSNSILLNISYLANYNYQNSEKETFNYSEITNNYNTTDTLLTNNYLYTNLVHSPGAGIRYQKGKVNLSVGLVYQYSILKNKEYFPGNLLFTKVYASLLPNAMLMVKVTDKKNIRINYRSSNNPPSIEQFQSVINNSNPLQLTTGNPDLEQDWQHNINMRYSAVNTAKNSSFFFLINYNYTKNYIGNSTILATILPVVINNYLLPEGVQITQPVNFSEAHNIRSFVNYSFAVPIIKSNLNLYAGLSFGRIPGLINETLNYQQNTSPNLGISITSNVSKNLDFSISTSANITYTKNSEQPQFDANYLNQTSRLKLNILPWKGLVIAAELNHQYYAGLSENYNENFYLCNAGIGYKFLKNKPLELRFSVFDIFDQNKNITRNITETYYEDSRANVLTRYFMLTVTYNLKFFKEQPVKQ